MNQIYVLTYYPERENNKHEINSHLLSVINDQATYSLMSTIRGELEHSQLCTQMFTYSINIK